MIEVRPGQRLRSMACDTQVMVVKGKGSYDIRCGGVPMSTAAVGDRVAVVEGFDQGSVTGKRYVDGDQLELLCVHAGVGSLSCGDTLLALQEAKPLPPSD